jgi:hypothetical protein
MLGGFRMAHKVDELPIFEKAEEFCVAVTAQDSGMKDEG